MQDKVLAAFRKFDSKHRDTKEWLNWTEKRNHNWAVMHDEKLYPAKFIRSLATRIPVGNFKGGPPTNSFFTDLGFSVQHLRNETQMKPGEDETGSTVPELNETAQYRIEDAMKGVFMAPHDFATIVAALNRKKNVVLQGPPGVGKTFVARKVAYALIGKSEPEFVELIQFHQSYGYEDFVQGFRPSHEGGFVLRNGHFFNFCQRAAGDLHNKYVYIIDEINRGNLSKIFGELLMLIESDKRSEAFAVLLAYSGENAPPFYVPPNVHILGMMNTADRSLAMVDYALRRRFSFFDVRPEIHSDRFRKFLTGRIIPDVLDKLIARISSLNEVIRLDSTNLGPGFEIGHSFFCPNERDRHTGHEWYEFVINSEIAPLLREYWFDAPSRAEEEIRKLLQ